MKSKQKTTFEYYWDLIPGRLKSVVITICALLLYKVLKFVFPEINFDADIAATVAALGGLLTAQGIETLKK